MNSPGHGNLYLVGRTQGIVGSFLVVAVDQVHSSNIPKTSKGGGLKADSH